MVKTDLPADIKKLSFEKALGELEGIVHELEKGQADLDAGAPPQGMGDVPLPLRHVQDQAPVRRPGHRPGGRRRKRVIRKGGRSEPLLE